MDIAPYGHRPEGPVVGKRRIGPCPPHGPMMVAAEERKAYVARCLRCGLSGPTREDGADAKRAFDKTFEEGRYVARNGGPYQALHLPHSPNGRIL